MTISLSNYREVKRIFTEALEDQAVRIKNRGDIDSFLRNQIALLKKYKKQSIKIDTIQGTWVCYFENMFNLKDVSECEVVTIY